MFQVKIGNIRPTAVGFVYYKTNLWRDNEGFRVGMIILIVTTILVIIAVLMFLLHKQKETKRIIARK